MIDFQQTWGETLFYCYDLEKKEQWLSAVSMIKELDIYYQPDYCRVFEKEGEGTAHLCLYKKDHDWLIYPFFLREINSLPYFKGKLSRTYYDIISPYGYSGPVVICSKKDDHSIIGSFREYFDQYCQEKNIVTEFIRFHPLLDSFLDAWKNHLEVEKAKSVVIVDLERTEESIWADYKYNNQKNINKAKREGVEVLIEENPDRFSAFLDIYRSTMDRRKAGSYYYFSESFFQNIHSVLNGNYVYAYALKNREIVSAELLLFNKYYLHSFLGGTLPSFFFYRPNNLLKHHVILWAKARGLKYFVLGGGYEENDGIFQYKCAFSPTGVRDFYVGKKIHNQEAVNYLEGVRKCNVDSNLEQTNFFPTYRSR